MTRLADLTTASCPARLAQPRSLRTRSAWPGRELPLQGVSGSAASRGVPLSVAKGIVEWRDRPASDAEELVLDWLMRRGALRLTAPLAVAASIGLGAVASPMLSAAAAPRLAPVSPVELVADVMASHVGAFWGVVRWNAGLGLPSLAGAEAGQAPSQAAGFNPASLLSGSHQVRVWYGGPTRQRLALSRSLAETDLVHNGNQAWLWDSATGAVTHFVGPSSVGFQHPQSSMGMAAMTPQQLAKAVVGRVGRYSTMSVSSPIRLAGRPAYQLELVPSGTTAASSTVAKVVVSVDARTHMVLGLSVWAKGQVAPVLSVGFSDIHYGSPPASEFSAPAGRVAKTVELGRLPSRDSRRGAPRASAPAISGSGWAKMVTFPAARLGRGTAALYSASTTVQGSFGTARLLRTPLVSALVFPDGKVVAGLVTPSALEAAASGA